MSQRDLDVDALLNSIIKWRAGGFSLSDLFVAAGAKTVSDADLLAAVRARLSQRPDLIDLWQGYSYDKRWTPSPYLDGLEVGHYDAGYQHVRRHESPLDACADFVLTEVRWATDRLVIEAS